MDGNRQIRWNLAIVFLVLSIIFLVIDSELAYAKSFEIKANNITGDSNSSQDATNKAIESLQSGIMTYTFPHEMIIGQDYIIEVLLFRGNQSENITSGMINQSKNITFENYKIMKVDLLGEDFKIAQITPERKRILDNTYAEWAWHVVPLREGNLKLTFVLSSTIYPDNGSIIKAVDTVVVQAYPSIFLQQTSKLIQKLYYLILIIIPLFSLLMRKSVREKVRKWRNS